MTNTVCAQRRATSEEDAFLDVYRRITAEAPKRGNLVPDSHLAAILTQRGIKALYAHDRAFRKLGVWAIKHPFA